MMLLKLRTQEQGISRFLLDMDGPRSPSSVNTPTWSHMIGSRCALKTTYIWNPKFIISSYDILSLQVATDGILKFCFRNPLLGKNQRTTIFKLFDILAALCDDFQDSRQVEALEEEINVVLALIERDFPISIQVRPI